MTSDATKPPTIEMCIRDRFECVETIVYDIYHFVYFPLDVCVHFRKLLFGRQIRKSVFRIGKIPEEFLRGIVNEFFKQLAFIRKPRV